MAAIAIFAPLLAGIERRLQYSGPKPMPAGGAHLIPCAMLDSGALVCPVCHFSPQHGGVDSAIDCVAIR